MFLKMKQLIPCKRVTRLKHRNICQFNKKSTVQFVFIKHFKLN